MGDVDRIRRIEPAVQLTGQVQRTPESREKPNYNRNSRNAPEDSVELHDDDEPTDVVDSTESPIEVEPDESLDIVA